MKKLFDGRRKPIYPRVCPNHSYRPIERRYFYRTDSIDSTNERWVVYLQGYNNKPKAINDFMSYGYPICAEPLCGMILDKPR